MYHPHSQCRPRLYVIRSDSGFARQKFEFAALCTTSIVRTVAAEYRFRLQTKVATLKRLALRLSTQVSQVSQVSISIRDTNKIWECVSAGAV